MKENSHAKASHCLFTFDSRGLHTTEVMELRSRAKNSWQRVGDNSGTTAPVCKRVTTTCACKGGGKGGRILCSAGELTLSDTVEGMNDGWYSRYPWFCYACLEFQKGPSRWFCEDCKADVCLSCGEKQLSGGRATGSQRESVALESGRSFKQSKILRKATNKHLFVDDIAFSILGHAVTIPGGTVAKLKSMAVYLMDGGLVLLPIGTGIYDMLFHPQTFYFDGCCKRPEGILYPSRRTTCFSKPIPFEVCIENNNGDNFIDVLGSEMYKTVTYSICPYYFSLLFLAAVQYHTLVTERRESQRLISFGVYKTRKYFQSSESINMATIMVYLGLVVLSKRFELLRRDYYKPLKGNESLYPTFNLDNKSHAEAEDNVLQSVIALGTALLVYLPMLIRLYFYRSDRFRIMSPKVLAQADEENEEEHVFKFDGSRTMQKM